VFLSFCKFWFSPKVVGQMYPFGSHHTFKRRDTMTYQGDFTLPPELLEQIAILVLIISRYSSGSSSMQQWIPNASNIWMQYLTNFTERQVHAKCF